MFCIILISFFLRTYQLQNVPPGISIDEMAFGYNAYSLLKTGRDEYGSFLPITLRAFNDYRPALLSYLIIPFIKIFGLNAFGIRFASVILSIITLIALYRITVLLFLIKTNDNKSPPKVSTYHTSSIISLLVISLYAISPWNIYLSRLALDTNAGLMFFSVAFWIFLEYLVNKKVPFLLGSFILFAVSFYAYNGIKLFIPFFLLTLLFVFYKTVLKRKKDFIIALILIAIIVSPLLVTYLNKNNLIRFNSLDFVSQEKPLVLQISSQRLLYENNDITGKIFDNRRITIVPLYITNFLVNINPTWLYADDYQHEEYKTPDFGLFYFFELLLLLFGLYYLIKEKVFPQNIFYLLIGWIILSIIPAAVTYDTPSAVRIYTALPALLIIEGCGLYYILYWIYKQKSILKNISYGVLFFIIGVSFMWFIHTYFVILPFQLSQNFSYGVVDAIQYGSTHQTSYKHIIISNRGDLEFSYIYYLFDTTYDPELYLKHGGTISGNFDSNHSIGKFAFINPNLFISDNNIEKYNPHAIQPKSLYIVDATDFPQNKILDNAIFKKIHLLKIITFLNTQPAIYIFTSK